MTKKHLAFETAFAVLLVNLSAIWLHSLHLYGAWRLQFVLQFAFGAVPILVYRYQDRPLANLGFGAKQPLRQLLFALLMLLAILVWGSATTLGYCLTGSSFAEALGGKLSGSEPLAMLLIFQLFFVGFGEEILFRGYFLDRILAISSSRKTALILTSVLFGFGHFWAARSVMQVMTTALCGYILAYGRLRFKDCSVVSVALAHGVYNCILVLIRIFLL